MIICASVKIRATATARDVFLCGVRHADCFSQLEALGFKPKQGYVELEQGFMTHDGRFLNRNEAWAHAKECGQLAASISMCWNPIPGELYSEDLW